MKKRSYLVGILLLLFAAALAVTATIYYTARLNGKVIEYRDLAAIFTAFIVSGSFIITTINTKLNADSNEAKLQFDRNKFGHDIKLLAFNLFKEYNSELMVAHNEVAVAFIRQFGGLGEAELVVKLNGDIPSSKAVTMLLNHLELTAISFTEDMGDRALIKELFLNIFMVQYGQFDIYIKVKQKSSPNFFDTFSTLAETWKAEIEKKK